MAIRSRRHDGLHRDGAAGAGAVLDDDGLPEPLGESGCESPRRGIGRSTRWGGNHQPNGFVRQLGDGRVRSKGERKR